jgi:Mg-chelatase subunit ChlD
VKIERKKTGPVSSRSGPLSLRLKELSHQLGGDRITRTSGLVWVLLDTSGSMDGAPLVQSKHGLEAFSKEAIEMGYMVGIITFNNLARVVVHETNDLEVISHSLRSLEAFGGTEIAPSIRMATERLSDGTRLRTIYLITDGFAHDPEETRKAADEAKAAGIDIMTLGTEEADHGFLRDLATRSDLARRTEKIALEEGIAKAVRLLPKPPKS